MLSFDNRSGNGDADSNGSETKLKYMIEKMAMKKKMKMVFMMMMTMSAPQWAQGRSWPAGWDGSRCRSPTRSAEKKIDWVDDDEDEDSSLRRKINPPNLMIPLSIYMEPKKI